MASSKDLTIIRPPNDQDPTLTSTTLPFASFSLTLALLTPTPTIPKSLSSTPTTIKLPTQLSTLHPLLPSPSPIPTPNSKSLSISSSSVLSPFPISIHRNLPSDPNNPFPLARRRILLWFRSDLRLHDNEALASASSSSSSLLPVFIFDPRDFGKSPSGFDRTGPYRANFLLNSVADLRNNLRSRGAELIIRIGRPEEILLELARSAGADALYAHSEVSRDECQVEEKVMKAMEKEGVEVRYFWGSTLYHLEDLPFGLEEMPLNYGGFKEKVNEVQMRKVIEVPAEIKGVPLRNGLEPGEVPTLQQLGLSPPPAISQVSCFSVCYLEHV